MSVKDIHSVIDLYDDRSAAQRVAIDLAARLKAHLTGLAPVLEPLVPNYLAAPIPVDYVMIAIEEAEKQAKVAQERFAHAAATSGVPVETRSLTALAGTTNGVVSQVHLSDMVVIGQEHEDYSEPMRGALIEALLFDAGVPTLVVPKDYERPLNLDLAIIAWDGSRTAAHAVHAAIPLLVETGRAEIVVVRNAADVEGEPGADVAVYLARHGVSVTVKQLERNNREPAHVLLDHAVNMRADYVVMGGYGHSRLREFVLGGTTRTVLQEATIPVLMAH